MLLANGLILCVFAPLLLRHDQLHALLLDALTVLAQPVLHGLGLARCCGAALSHALLFLL